MKRLLYKNLLEWKSSKLRKPLLLQGARQVGKTHLVTEFGNNEYDDFVYLNLERDSGLKTLFSGTFDPAGILSNIGLYLGRKITTDKTLVFFDEVQVSPEALTSLKYFYEQKPDLHIIAAGSLLGVSVGKESSFPVGKVNFMTLHPMIFSEFLMASGEEMLSEEISKRQYPEALPEVIHTKLLENLKLYLFLGGMPEVLQIYISEKDIALARSIQKDILNAYERDFSKYTEKAQTIKTSELWHSVPYQLAKENKKFKYGDVRKNSRASTFEQTIEWLNKAGLINIACCARSAKIPLPGYADSSRFKIYLFDTGLLGAMLGLQSDMILKPNDLFSEYHGAFIENFVASELIASGENGLYYWSSRSDAEVDFLLQHHKDIFPLEVKSGTGRNMKSLRSYADKFDPKLVLRTSPRNYTRDDDFINIPLYAVSNVSSIVSHCME